MSSEGEQGFTLIEILVVMAMITIFAGMGLFLTLDTYRGSFFRSELTVMVNLLQKARNQAVNNIDQMPHGVRIESNEYIVFHGVPYDPGDPNNERIHANSEMAVTGLSEIVFDQLTGNVDSSMTGSITVQYGARTEVITINDEGRIDW